MFNKNLKTVALLLVVIIGLLMSLPNAPATEATSGRVSSVAGWEEVWSGSASGTGASDSSDDSIEPAIATFGEDFVVAWTESQGTSSDIYVKRWDDDDEIWQPFGFTNISGEFGYIHISRRAAIALDPDGNPAVAWEQFYSDGLGGESKIEVWKWDGDKWDWDVVGDGNSLGRDDLQSTNPALVYWEKSNSPAVAWQQWLTDTWTIRTLVDDYYWSTVSEGDGDSYTPAIASANEELVVAWAHDPESPDQDSEIYLKRWDEGSESWKELGGSASDGGVSGNGTDSWRPSVVIDDAAQPIVAWEDKTGVDGQHQIHVSRWNATEGTWARMGSPLGGADEDSHAKRPSLTILPFLESERLPLILVAWQEGDEKEGGKIYVMRWEDMGWDDANGSWVGQWVEMNEGSASGDGVGGYLPAASQFASTALTNEGATVAWQYAGVGGNPAQIYVRDYELPCNNLALVEHGQGSLEIDDYDFPYLKSPACDEAYSFLPGELIKVIPNPAAGWAVTKWEGTVDDSKLHGSNLVHMPWHDHTVTVTYRTLNLLPIVTNR